MESKEWHEKSSEVFWEAEETVFLDSDDHRIHGKMQHGSNYCMIPR